jgi:RNA polymerase sigma factor
METIDNMAMNAQTNNELFSDFVIKQKRFIIHCAFLVTHHYITINDDEWSIALIGFSNAVKSYHLEKGHFLSYAELIIKRHLIDYYRSMNKYNLELSVNPSIFEIKPDSSDDNIGLKIEISKKIIAKTDSSIKFEIESISTIFQGYNFNFYALSKSSPKSKKTKAGCKQAILLILNDEDIMNELYETKRIPLKKIQKNTNLPRKLLERHRIYIIAAIVILSGEYPYLAEYIPFKGKEGV